MTEDHLYKAVRAIWARWSPDRLDRFPPPSKWEPAVEPVGTENPSPNPPLSGAVPTVPTVPTEIEKRAHGDDRSAEPVSPEGWEERAAILEFDAGMTRAEAEAAARAELGPKPEA